MRSRNTVLSYSVSFTVACSIMSSGPPPGIDLYADIKHTVISPVIALMVLSGASVALRVVTKLSIKAKFQLDDYFLFAALVGASPRGQRCCC